MHSSYNGVHCSQLIDRRLTFVLMLGIIIQQPKSQTIFHTSGLVSLLLRLTLARSNSTRINANKHTYSESLINKHVPDATIEKAEPVHLC